MSSEDFESVWRSCRERSERALVAHLPVHGDASRLHSAMRYASLNGGKRFRAMLVYLCGELVGADDADLDVAAAAVEMIHAYSLIHDDLPAMDDDDERRGQPSCHVKFDEATAILAGDALQSLAFEILSGDAMSLPAARKLQMVNALANAIGARGMAGGQAHDVDVEHCAQTIPDLQHIHELKTGALIRAAAKIGGLAAPQVDDELLTRLDVYAANIGLAFQIADDVLDAGEQVGAEGKVTYVSLLGADEAAARARELCDNARTEIAVFGDQAKHLQQLAQFTVTRTF